MDLRTGITATMIRLVLAALLLGIAGGAGAALSLEQQRQAFLDAEKALDRSHDGRYQALRRQLADYPLLPYLDYRALDGRLSHADRDEVARFLQRYADTPLAQRLRASWLALLARRGKWRTYLDFFTPSKATERRCDYLHALIATGHAKTAYRQVAQLWLVGRSQPRQCDPVLNAWRKAGHLTRELVWKRIGLAMDNGETHLARYLERFLGKNDRTWVRRWLRVRAEPGLILSGRLFGHAHPWRNEILLYGLNRLAHKDPARVAFAWDTLRGRYRLTADQTTRGKRIVATAYIRQDSPDLLSQLDGIHPGNDLKLHHQRILAALENEDWERALYWIDALPGQDRKDERWRYWKGRALQKLGRNDEALAVLTDVARDRTYYAFLAADRIGAHYYLEHDPVKVDPALLSHIEGMPAARRAHELRALNRRLDARREWWWLTKDLKPRELQAAALLASQWGWYDQAIFTLARSDYWDDLELRFPLAYLDLVRHQAGVNGLQVPWVLAVVRQESAFGADAISHAGARGLMQLMPGTARRVARRLGKPRPRRGDLLHPATNIPLGTAYLSQVYHELDDNPVLATAAYNAGPRRVERWLPERTEDADLWVETIPFAETRGYVKRVMAYAVIYEKRLGKTPGSILERMRPIPGTVTRDKTSGRIGSKKGSNT